MLLTIDVGNTQTVLGLFEGEELLEHWRMRTDARRTADETAITVASMLAQHPGGTLVTGVALCSTVPSVLREMRGMLERYHDHVPHVVVEPGVKTGVPVLTDNPREVGTDRVVNAVAAVHLVGGPAIVVDFGTATTFDAVSAKGEYLGGAIAPGIEISVDALGLRGAQLQKVEITRPRSVIGKNTVEALQSGIVFGFAGQVDGLVTAMRRELAPGAEDSVTVIATGGLAPLVIAEAETLDRHEPWLTLIGLRLVYERNIRG